MPQPHTQALGAHANTNSGKLRFDCRDFCAGGLAKQRRALQGRCSQKIKSYFGNWAADLGGNCYADLEERAAELEASTVRKGNRTVSLTISGWVAEQVVWWDDGFEQNAYVTSTGTTLASHFKLTGWAQIYPGLQAGYVMHIEVITGDPSIENQIFDDADPVNLADVQVDPAPMSFWLYWRHFKGDATCQDNDDDDNLCNFVNYVDESSTRASLEDFDLIKFGALISF